MNWLRHRKPLVDRSLTARELGLLHQRLDGDPTRDPRGGRSEKAALDAVIHSAAASAKQVGGSVDSDAPGHSITS